MQGRAEQGASESSDRARATELLALHLSELEAGEEIDVEGLAVEHPALAAELRALVGVFRRVDAGLGGGAASSTFAERLAALGAAEADPRIALEEEPAAEPLSDLVVRRLARRAGASERYQLKGEIAHGGMGAILRVWDQDLRRTLAMKVVLGRESSGEKKPASPGTDTRSLARFLEEAQVTGQLDHPGIVPVHELGLDSQGRCYFTMRLVRGRDLREVLRLSREEREGWNLMRAVGVLHKVCEAMAYAHSRGVIHRDLKPSNIMVGRFGEVYVMDWGLARVLDRADSRDLRIAAGPLDSVSRVRTELRGPEGEGSPLRTMDGDVVGTPAFMAPEQARGELERIGPRSDVYSVGAILYQLLAGEMPYAKQGEKLSARTIWLRVIEGAPAPLAERAPKAPEELVAVCEKAMARDPARRYADMQALAEELRAWLEGRVVRAHRTGPWIELRKWVGRNRLAAGASAAALCVLVLAGALFTWRRGIELERLRLDSARLVALDLLEEGRVAFALSPADFGKLEAWVARAEAALADLPSLRERLARLEARGRPLDGGAEAASLRDERLSLASFHTEFGKVLADYRRMLEAGGPTPQEAQEKLVSLELLAREVPILELEVADLERELARVDLELHARRELDFDEPSERADFERLRDHLAALERLVDPKVGVLATVRARLAEARRRWPSETDLEQLWSAARRSMADRAECPLYRGFAHERHPQLVPLGRDAHSGLWEFWLPASGERPERRADGSFAIAHDTGLVFVLVPADDFLAGAQREDPNAPNYDPQASPEESPPHEIRGLAPYFLSKYELTQGQWRLLTGRTPAQFRAGEDYAPPIERITLAHPVENVSWAECTESLADWGLTLPTEAQWELAARAGREGPRHGAELPAFGPLVNGYDDTIATLEGYQGPNWSDGFVYHAPVDALPASPYGFHAMLGNVWEWCRDWFAHQERSEPVGPTGERRILDAVADHKSLRGGGFMNRERFLRVSTRKDLHRLGRSFDLGLRPIVAQRFSRARQ